MPEAIGRAPAARIPRLPRPPRWALFNGAAVACGLLPIVLACTDRDHGTANDPAMVFHRYTLLQVSGPEVLIYVGAPAVLGVVLALLLREKTRRRSVRLDRLAWCLVTVICLLCLVGTFIEGLEPLAEAVLVVCAAAAAPMPPDPNERLLRDGSFFDRDQHAHTGDRPAGSTTPLKRGRPAHGGPPSERT